MRICFGIAGLVAVFFTGGSCAPVPNVTPYPHPLGIVDRIERSNLIVVGVVQSEASLRGGRRTESADSMPLELRMVGLRVEGVIKGQYDGDQLSFFYYHATGAWDGPAPNLLVPGQRAIFYLRREGGTLRATNDAYSSHTEIVTGKHAIQAVASAEGIRELIARLLLVPGEGVDISRYVASLYVEVAVALDIISQAQTADLLTGLLRNSSGQVRGRACILLAQAPLARRDCLQKVISDPEASPEDRKRAEELMAKPTARP